MKTRGAVLLALFIFFTISIAQAEPTKLVVKVKGKGSKFVGTSVGGARVTIKDMNTGKVLSEGITEGSTGNTDLIMRTPRLEGEPISDSTAARFSTTLDIAEPLFVEISASGPLAYPDSLQRIFITQWILPGKDITENDGLVLELPGLIVDIIDMPQTVHLSDIKDSVAVSVQVGVSMICGCPLVPGGIWDAHHYTMKAMIRQNGNVLHEIPLSYEGKPGFFSVPLKIDRAGTYRLAVYAFDPRNGNAGIDSIDLEVKE